MNRVEVVWGYLCQAKINSKVQDQTCQPKEGGPLAPAPPATHVPPRLAPTRRVPATVPHISLGVMATASMSVTRAWCTRPPQMGLQGKGG